MPPTTAVGGSSRASIWAQPVRPPASDNGCSEMHQSGKPNPALFDRGTDTRQARLLTIVELLSAEHDPNSPVTERNQVLCRQAPGADVVNADGAETGLVAPGHDHRNIGAVDQVPGGLRPLRPDEHDAVDAAGEQHAQGLGFRGSAIVMRCDEELITVL